MCCLDKYGNSRFFGEGKHKQKTKTQNIFHRKLLASPGKMYDVCGTALTDNFSCLLVPMEKLSRWIHINPTTAAAAAAAAAFPSTWEPPLIHAPFVLARGAKGRIPFRRRCVAGTRSAGCYLSSAKVKPKFYPQNQAPSLLDYCTYIEEFTPVKRDWKWRKLCFCQNQCFICLLLKNRAWYFQAGMDMLTQP